MLAGAAVGFVLADEVGQAFEAEVREGGDLLVVGPMDPEATVLRCHVDIDVPQQLGVLTEHLGGEREGIDPGDRSHGQAASLASDRECQFQGRSSSMRWAGWSPTRPIRSAR